MDNFPNMIALIVQIEVAGVVFSGLPH